MRITNLLRKTGAYLNPPAHPNDPGPYPQLRDYPIARRSSRSSPGGPSRSRR